MKVVHGAVSASRVSRFDIGSRAEVGGVWVPAILAAVHVVTRSLPVYRSSFLDSPLAINLVYAFKLKPYDIDKKQYTKYIKEYGKKLVDKLKAAGKSDEDIDAFKAKMAKKCGEIVKSK